MSESKKRRMSDVRHFKAERLLKEGESVHQVWRQTRISKPYIQDLRDDMRADGRLPPPKTLNHTFAKNFGT